MQTVTLGVSLSPDKSVEVLNGIDIVEELKENREDGYRVGRRADSSVVVTDSRECDLLYSC